MDFGSIRFGSQIAAAATAHNLDPALLAAVAAQETGGPGASSGSNIVGDGGHGRGLFQIDDRSWAFAKTPAAMDPARNADFAAGILADNLQRYGGNVRDALSAYNAGSPSATGSTTTWADGAKLGYADSVMRHYDELTDSSSPQEALAAESLENSANVGALANAYQTGASSNVASTTSPYASADSSLALTSPTSTSPFGAVSSWNQVSSAGQQLGASTVSTMADMIDSGDVYATDGDDG